MDGFAPLIAVFLVVVAPIWIIFHYITQWKTKHGLTPQDERLLADLWQVAQKVEARLANLEAVLDHDAPGWRRQAAEGREAVSATAVMEKK